MKEMFFKLIQEFRARSIPEFIPRSSIKIPLHTQKIISLIGPRRAGKSTYFYQILTDLMDEGLGIDQVFYFNFEDERLNGIQVEDLDQLLEVCKEQALVPLSECVFFFDEIQDIPLWDKFIRRLYDTVSKKLFITGSNSKLLSTEIPTHLRGRALAYHLRPLSFLEFCIFKRTAPSIQATVEYLEFGGVPEVSQTIDPVTKIYILQEYFNTMLYQDLVERYSITNPALLKTFAHKLIDSAGTIFSVKKTYDQLRTALF